MVEYQASHKYSEGQINITQDFAISLKLYPKSRLIARKKFSPSILKKAKEKREDRISHYATG